MAAIGRVYAPGVSARCARRSSSSACLPPSGSGRRARTASASKSSSQSLRAAATTPRFTFGGSSIRKSGTKPTSPPKWITASANASTPRPASMWSAVSSGQIASISCATTPGATSSPTKKPSTSGAVRELVQSGVDAVDRAPELGLECGAVAQVVAVGEHDPLRDRRPVAAEQLQALVGDHRVEQGRRGSVT